MELKDKLITFGNLSHYDEKIKEYIEEHEKDADTTYTLSKNGSQIILTGSDGKTSSVVDVDTDTNTTYTLSKNNNQIVLTSSDGKTSSVVDIDTDTTYTLSSSENQITLTGSDGSTSSVTVEGGGADGLIYKETTTTKTITVTTPSNDIEIPVLCYGDGRLILHDDKSGLAYYSDNKGESWQTANDAKSEKIIFGNGVFIGIAEGLSGVRYSTDGINWQTVDLFGYALHLIDIAFGDGKFIAVGDDGAAISTDGITWSRFEASGNYVAIGNGRVVITDTTGMYSVYSLDGNSIVSSASIPGMDPINGIKFINNQFICHGNIIATSSDGETWQTFELPMDTTTNDILYIKGKYILYIDDNAIFTTTTIGEQWSRVGTYDELYNLSIADTGNLLVGCGAETGIVCSSDGIQWGASATITNSKAYLEQAGTDVTSKVAKLVGGSGGGNVDLENATLENLTITGALTIEGDLAFGDLDVTTVTAEKVIVTSDPVDDNDVATKKYVDENGGGGGTSLPLTTVSSTNTAQANYTHTITGDANAIFGKGGTTVVGSGNLMAGHQGAKNVTGSGNIVVGNGGTDYIRQGSSGESIGNILVGSSLDITGSYNIVDGATHKVTGLYNIISGRNHEITGNYNVITGTGEFNTAKTIVTGKANFVSGDFSNSSITGNYNSIINGGGDNLITGDDPNTGADKAQHNMIIGSTTTIRNSENCLTLGRLNTIDNHNRSVLMGIGLTATRDNQLIVGSYNDDGKQGGIFVVGNGTGSEVESIGQTYSGYEVYIYDWPTTANYYAVNDATGETVRISYTANGWTTNSTVLKIYGNVGEMQYIMPNDDSVWDIYRSNKSNAMTVYAEGTVTIGHDPIGPMDVATKQYVDSHSSGSGGVDEAQVRAIVEDVLLNGNW